MNPKLALFEQLKLSKDKVNHLNGGKKALPLGGRLESVIIHDIIID